jgi:hypothetical protein
MSSNWDQATTKLQRRHLLVGLVRHDCSQNRTQSSLVVLGGLHIGGGIDEKNAIHWLELGAEKVCLSQAPSRQL